MADRGAARVAVIDSRLRVLFIPQWYPAKDGRNHALGTYCREHVRAAALYDDVAVLAYNSRADHWPTLAWERIDDAGIPTFYGDFGLSPIPKTTYPFFLFNLRRAILRVLKEWGRPDVVHTQDAYAYHVLKSVRNLRFPLVVSQHWSGFMRRSLTASEARRFRWSLQRAALMFSVNRFSTADYEAYGITTPVTWLPNALDTRVFYPAEASNRKPWLLHVSGFTGVKRFPDVVEAFAEARRRRPDAVLHVAGEGTARAQAEALAQRELPASSFCFHGYLPKTDVAALMRRSCGLVLPSEFETFGCVLMEAMACGCPVLTTRVGGIPAVVRDGEGLFVKVGDIADLADKMVRLIDGAHELDLAGISHGVRERFSYEAVGQILHEGHLRAGFDRCVPEQNGRRHALMARACLPRAPRPE